MSYESTESAQLPSLDDLTPKKIVEQLDRFIIGQTSAKRSVSIALRNRWRRQQVQEPLRNEIYPKNIIMIGPTGVGKTEIARRLSRLAKAPFVKVEASKFTEVGYVGRDVESMIRDLTEISFQMVQKEESELVIQKAQDLAENKIIDQLFPVSEKKTPEYELDQTPPQVFSVAPNGSVAPAQPEERDELLQKLRNGEFDDRELSINVKESSMPMMQVFSNSGMEEMGLNMQELFDNSPFGRRKKQRNLKVKEALPILVEQESQKLVDREKVIAEAINRVEESGIVFIDEIDKVARREGGGKSGPDVSREGVQRDILPIVEGSTVTTKYGLVKTDHILFIAAGAFHISSISDLIPELQGRFPIRVELDSLNENDFYLILTEPENSLVKQYCALLETEDITLQFHDDALKEISRLAALVNQRSENIGARRLHTIMERLLDELSFEASDLDHQTISIDKNYVDQHLIDVIENEDLSRYIL